MIWMDFDCISESWLDYMQLGTQSTYYSMIFTNQCKFSYVDKPQESEVLSINSAKTKNKYPFY